MPLSKPSTTQVKHTLIRSEGLEPVERISFIRPVFGNHSELCFVAPFFLQSMYTKGLYAFPQMISIIRNESTSNVQLASTWILGQGYMSLFIYTPR